MEENINNSRAQKIAVSIKENLSEISRPSENKKKLAFSDYSKIQNTITNNEKDTPENISETDKGRKAEKQKSRKIEKYHESIYLTYQQSNLAEEIKLKWRREGKKVTKSQVYFEAVQLLYDKTFLFGKTR